DFHVTGVQTCALPIYQFLANIREVNAILHVVRCFENDNVIHVDGKVDPVQDKEIIDTELLLKDIETVSKRVERLRKNAKSGEKEIGRASCRERAERTV